MRPPSFMRSVIDRNVVMWRIPVQAYTAIHPTAVSVAWSLAFAAT